MNDEIKPIIDEIRDGVRYRKYPAMCAEGYDPCLRWEEAEPDEEECLRDIKKQKRSK